MFPGLSARRFGLVGRRPKVSSANREDLSAIGQTEQTRNPVSAFAIGFACNALNPKAMLFIVSLFSQVISPKTALPMEIGYGVFIAMTHMLWFSLVAVALTLPAVQVRIQAIKKWIERGVGLCLTGLGIRLLAS
jgi:threonine/homoserine/homoserine lactone efflux protein